MEHSPMLNYLCNQRHSISVRSTKGLLNKPGQNNCFLNSAVQVLWHLDIFRRSFRELNGHTCMAESCIFCALKEIFAQFQYSKETALPPDILRRALAETFYDQRRFQLGFMDDASECFENILLRIHWHIANEESEDMCNAEHCIPHTKFAMTLVEQTSCHSCGATSEPLPFTQMVHYVSASALCSQANSMCLNGLKPSEMFGNLLKSAAAIGDVRDCSSFCGAKILIQKTLMNHPEIVSVGIVWDSERPSLDQIMGVLNNVGLKLRLQDAFHSVVDFNWASSTVHNLVGIVTYYGKHYSTFFYHSKLGVWIYFDDAAVREVGPRWDQVVEKCRRGHFQPLLLLYADPCGNPVSVISAPSDITYVQDHKRNDSRSATPSIVHSIIHQNGNQLNSSTPGPFWTKEFYTPTTINYDSTNGNSQSETERNELHQHPIRCTDQNCNYEECEEHCTYISRKVVESVMNFQKQQRQQKTHPLIGQQNSIGSRISSSSLESLDNTLKPSSAILGLVQNHKPLPPLRIVQRVDSGNWSGSGDRLSASSSNSSASIEQFKMPGKRHLHLGRIKRNRLQELGGADQGYDSFSLSSTDSYPSMGNGSPSRTEPRLTQILENVSSQQSEDCDKLCSEADLLLQKSTSKEKEGDLQMAALLSDAAAAKARLAMDAPYNNAQSLVSAKMKHSLCVMRSSNIHRRIKEAEMEERRMLSEASHQRQSSRDSTHNRHSRQGSRDSSHSRPGSKPHSRQGSFEELEQRESSKTIELYATLPRKTLKKKVANEIQLSNETSFKEDFAANGFKTRTSPLTLNSKISFKNKDLSSDYSDWEIRKDVLSRTCSSPTGTSGKICRGEEASEPKKQHKIRRKLMGTLMRSKNRSLPDLREGQDRSDEVKTIFDTSPILPGLISPKCTERKEILTDYLSDGSAYNMSRGFHQPHRAFVKNGAYQRPLLTKVSPPTIDSPRIHEETRNDNAIGQPQSVIGLGSKNSFSQPHKDISPVLRIQNKEAHELNSFSLLNSSPRSLASPQEFPAKITIPTGNLQFMTPYDTIDSTSQPTCVEPRLTFEAKGLHSDAHAFKHDGDEAVTSFNSNKTPKILPPPEIATKEPLTRKRCQEELQKPQKPHYAYHRPPLEESKSCPLSDTKPAGSFLLRELQNKQMQIQMRKTHDRCPPAVPKRALTRQAAKPVLTIDSSKQANGNLCNTSVGLPPASQEPKISNSVKNLALRFEEVLKMPIHTDKTDFVDRNIFYGETGRTEVFLEKRPEAPETKSPNNSVPCGRMFTLTSTTAKTPTCTGIPKGEDLNHRPNCRMIIPAPENPLNSFKKEIGQVGESVEPKMDLRRPQKPPDYDTAIQRLGMIRVNENKTPEPPVSNEKVKASPRKSVTFSDQVILVACAEEDLEDPIPNPLLEKVYKQHILEHEANDAGINNTKLLERILCQLCHQQEVKAPEAYCQNCHFYMSKFSPRK